LWVEREVTNTGNYEDAFEVNDRSTIEVRNPEGAAKTVFRMVTRAIGEEAQTPGLRPSDSCKIELEVVRHMLDLSITYWTGQSPLETVSREVSQPRIDDNFQDLHNQLRQQQGLPPLHRFDETFKIPVCSTASMTLATVESILSYCKLCYEDTAKKWDVLMLYRAGVLVPEDALFHWYKIVEIAQLPEVAILGNNNKLLVDIPGISTEILGAGPQNIRHIRENAQNAKKHSVTQEEYRRHLTPVIEYYIEKC
jgi:hypothetical protein